MDNSQDGGNSWGDIFSTVKDLGSAGASVYSSLQDNVAQPSAAATPASPTASANVSKFLPLIIGGGLLLVVILFLMGRK